MTWYKKAQLQGYTFAHSGSPDAGHGLSVTVSFNGDVVGGGVFRNDSHGDNENSPMADEMWCDGIEIDETHRRKGLATAIYQYAERLTGKKLIPSSDLTPASAALWQKAPRSFGSPRSDDILNGWREQGLI